MKDSSFNNNIFPFPDDEPKDSADLGPFSSPAERTIVWALSTLDWMLAQPRTHEVIRHLCSELSPEEFAHWLTSFAALAMPHASRRDADSPLDRLVRAVDPQESCTIEELARQIADPGVLGRYQTYLRRPPQPSVNGEAAPATPTPTTAPTLTEKARAAIDRLDLARSGPFSIELLETLRVRLSPKAFEQRLLMVEQIGAAYPDLKPKYCETALAEIVREVRGLLRQRWGTAMLTAPDVALFFDAGTLKKAERRLLKRRR